MDIHTQGHFHTINKHMHHVHNVKTNNVHQIKSSSKYIRENKKENKQKNPQLQKLIKYTSTAVYVPNPNPKPKKLYRRSTYFVKKESSSSTPWQVESNASRKKGIV
jgi:predicted transcriptional regulator